MRPRTEPFHLVLAAALFLSACIGSPPPTPVKPDDPGLDSGWRLARFAFQKGEYDQAEILYERALSRAYARDDASAIGDIGYEYALALLRNGKSQQAAEKTRRIRSELERRSTRPFAELFVVEAMAAYETGDFSRAYAAGREAVTRARPDDLDTRGRANFILGMIAASKRNADGVRKALAAMGTPANDALKADTAELRGRLHLLNQDAARALTIFQQTASLRRKLGDYGGMARVLASAGVAAESVGKPAIAADLYYRAGLSATLRKDTDTARVWLNKALKLAAANSLAAIETDVRDRLKSLEK